MQHMTIAEHIKKYMDNDGVISNPGGQFTGEDFLWMSQVFLGTADNFVIFDNAGGKPFTIWLLDKISIGTKKKDYLKFIDDKMAYVFMYKIDGVETVLRNLPKTS